jgi:hypothetical protein
MKSLNTILIPLLLIFYIHSINAQTINWKALDSIRHIINTNLGLDYSISYGLGYGYKLNTKLPIIINGNFSIPSGEKLVDDVKAKIGGQIRWLNKSKFVGAVAVYGIYRRHETRYVRLQNFGSEVKVMFGYYQSKWFVAAELGFDKAIVTHFKHSQEFRENIFVDVIDGWYEPATGGNFSYGLLTGYSLTRADITLNAGRVISQDFKTAPLFPFYLNLGFNYRLH